MAPNFEEEPSVGGGGGSTSGVIEVPSKSLTVNAADYPKNIEVIIGKLDHCSYAGIYERKKDSFLNERPVYFQTNVVNFITDVSIYYKTKTQIEREQSPKYIQWLPTDSGASYHWVFGPKLGESKAVFCSFCQVFSPTEASNWLVFAVKKNRWDKIPSNKMKHFLVFNYDFPKYLRVDVGPYPHRDKQGRYMLQPNRVNGRIIYKQITVEVETKESILNEDYNNKQKERVRRDFKDKIHHHGIKKDEARESLKAELTSEKKPPPDDKAQPPRPPMKYTNIIQWVTSNEKTANPGQRTKIWMIGTQEVSKMHSGNFGGLYSPNQVSNPGSCTQWFFCADSKEQSGAKVKEWKPAPDFRITKIVTPEHVKICSPEKTPCDGIYILHHTIQNGHIVYKQIENVIDEPYYIQWLKNKAGHYEWIVGKGMDKWNGEAWATCSFTLTGKNPERPVYKTTTMNTWPSKLRNWKYYNTKKRGGMWIPAHKDFHIDEAYLPGRIHVKGADELEKMPHIGSYVKSSDFLNGRYYWTMENKEQTADFKPFYIQWVEDATGLYLWCIGSQKNRAAAAIFSYDEHWCPQDITNWKYFANDEWHSTISQRKIQLDGNNPVEIGKRRHDINGLPGTGKKPVLTVIYEFDECHLAGILANKADESLKEKLDLVDHLCENTF